MLSKSGALRWWAPGAEEAIEGGLHSGDVPYRGGARKLDDVAKESTIMLSLLKRRHSMQTYHAVGSRCLCIIMATTSDVRFQARAARTIEAQFAN